MKIRSGFVSNSSTTSFMISFPEEPSSVDHAFGMMFGESAIDESFGYEDFDHNLKRLSMRDVAALVRGQVLGGANKIDLSHNYGSWDIIEFARHFDVSEDIWIRYDEIDSGLRRQFSDNKQELARQCTLQCHIPRLTEQLESYVRYILDNAGHFIVIVSMGDECSEHDKFCEIVGEKCRLNVKKLNR